MTHIEDLLKQRAALLAGNPKLQAFQDEIDVKLAHLTDTADRMAVLVSMTQEKIKEQQDAIKLMVNKLKGQPM